MDIYYLDTVNKRLTHQSGSTLSIFSIPNICQFFTNFSLLRAFEKLSEIGSLILKNCIQMLQFSKFCLENDDS